MSFAASPLVIGNTSTTPARTAGMHFGWLCFFDGRDGRCLTPISATWHEIIIQSKTVCCCTLNSRAYFADDERSFRESEARVCPAPAWGIWKRPLQLLFDADLRKRAQHRPHLPSPARYGQTWTVQAVLAPRIDRLQWICRELDMLLRCQPGHEQLVFLAEKNASVCPCWSNALAKGGV